MGGCISFQISCDQVFNSVGSYIFGKDNYVWYLKKNMVALKEAMEDLTATRDDVLRRVQKEEGNGLQRLQEVQLWLTRVDTIESQYNVDLDSTTITEELQKLSLCGDWPQKIKSRFSYGRRVFLMLQEAIKLKEHGVFDVVAESPIRDVAEEMPLQQIIVGQETMLIRAWDRLMDDGTHIMGLYGMGGVGKTTLLEQINNNFRGANDMVDIVIWIVVSKEKRVEKIQDDIAEKLGLRGGGWNQKTRSQKATDIHGSMRKKRFVLLLDDIWSKVDLKEIGVPFPNRENKCKILFTTRSREVCGRMGVDDPMKVICLAPDEAWELFQDKVGRNTLESHPDILDLACKVVEKCRGLPLAINVIGETMACKRTVQEWRNAIDILTSSAAELSGMEDEVLSILKYSYDNLKGEQVKSCFLYCALFAEDFLIVKRKLIDYWICEEFIDEKQGREKTLNQGHEILGTLVRACLLLEEKDHVDRQCVKMHDVVRDMALWIATDLGKHKERWIVQAGVGLHEVPKVENWNNVRRMSLMDNDIKMISESPDCPELTTLLLGRNDYLETISGKFFRSMPWLLVLDLSENLGLDGLPEQISRLVSLRYLDMSWTKIKRLPVGLQELKMLIHLNLEKTKSLESLGGISKLLSLRTLKLRESNLRLDLSLTKELQRLEHLEFISISTSPNLVGKLLVYGPRVPRCIQDLYIDGRGQESVRELVLPAMDNLCTVFIQNYGMSEIKIEKTPWNTNLTSPCFSNLSDLKIEICDGLKDLTWLLFAPNLIELTLGCLTQVEEVISKEKAENNIIPFQKLEVLTLSELPVLKNIYWNALPFQRLRELHVYGNCQKLRKLPLDSKSVFKVDEFVIKCSKSCEEWIQGFEWEDEATRQRFLHLCKLD